MQCRLWKLLTVNRLAQEVDGPVLDDLANLDSRRGSGRSSGGRSGLGCGGGLGLFLGGPLGGQLGGLGQKRRRVRDKRPCLRGCLEEATVGNLGF
jgi:hypothetical protein